MLLTECPVATRADFLAHARSTGAQDLMVPAEVRHVKKVPVLGSGKLDFAAVTRMAETGSKEQAA